MWRLKVLVFFLLWGFWAEGQIAKPVFRHYTTEQGLPSSETYMVLQDTKGYMWFATDRGVARFDGNKFQVYTTKEGLCDNSVLGLYEDYQNRIWFFTYSNQLSYYQEGKIFNSPANDSLKVNRDFRLPINMVVDSTDSILLGFKQNKGQGQFLKIDAAGKLSKATLVRPDSNAFVAIQQLATGEHIWSFSEIHSPHDLIYCDAQKNNKLFTDQLNGKQNLLKYGNNFSFHQTENDRFIFRLRNCIYEKKAATISLKFCEDMAGTLALLEDRQENIWIGTFDKGLLVYRKNHYEKPLYRLLEDRTVSGITQDKEGGIWLTTLSDGVFYIPSIDFLGIKTAEAFDNNRIGTFESTGPSLLLGFYEGEALQIDYSSTFDMKVKPIAKFDGLPRILSVEGPSDYLVINGSGQAKKTETIIWKEEKAKRTLGAYYILEHLYDEKEVLRINARGFFLLNLETGNDSLLFSVPVSESFQSLKVDDSKKIWLGGTSGLYSYDGITFVRPPHQNPLLNVRINGIACHEDKLLLATLGEGLVIQSADSIWQITEKDGLVSNLCNAVLKDSDQFFWVSTNKGLSRMKINWKPEIDVEITNYSHANGLLTSEIDEVLIRDSLVWARSDKGLSLFHRYYEEPENLAPRIHIQRFNINSRDTTIMDGHQLTYGQNNIELTYAGLSYKTGKNMRYKYRLLGLDSTWQHTNQNSLVYPQLPPGKYIFNVLAKNYRGQWSSEMAQLQFTIKQPFWSSWWFLAAGMFLLFGLLQGVLLIRFRVIKNKEHLLQRSFESEQKALQAQLNPHFIFNTLGSIQDLILSKEYNLANQNLITVSRLIRKILNHSRNQFIALSDEVESIETYMKLEKLRFGENLHWSIHIESEIDPELTPVPPMLLQPFIENAIWHGLQQRPEKNGTIDIRFQEEEKGMSCQIKDNGIGRKKALLLRGKYGHKPLGMKIIEERIELLNRNRKIPFRIKIEDLENEHQEALGTCVHIFFPRT